MSGLSAWPGTSEMLLGRNEFSAGAEPGGRTFAENSGVLSASETFRPGLCCHYRQHLAL